MDRVEAAGAEPGYRAWAAAVLPDMRKLMPASLNAAELGVRKMPKLHCSRHRTAHGLGFVGGSAVPCVVMGVLVGTATVTTQGLTGSLRHDKTKSGDF